MQIDEVSSASRNVTPGTCTGASVPRWREPAWPSVSSPHPLVDRGPGGGEQAPGNPGAPPVLPALVAALWGKNEVKSNCLLLSHPHLEDFAPSSTFRPKMPTGTCLVVQWIGTRLPEQETWVHSLIREDPTCHAAAKSVPQNY